MRLGRRGARRVKAGVGLARGVRGGRLIRASERASDVGGEIGKRSKG